MDEIGELKEMAESWTFGLKCQAGSNLVIDEVEFSKAIAGEGAFALIPACYD
jgi:hypothetical protein